MDCRCGALSMTQTQFERMGRSLTSPEALAAIEADLRDDWPIKVHPSPGFWSAAEPSRESAREPRLTTGQFAEVMKLFGSADGQAS